MIYPTNRVRFSHDAPCYPKCASIWVLWRHSQPFDTHRKSHVIFERCGELPCSQAATKGKMTKTAGTKRLHIAKVNRRPKGKIQAPKVKKNDAQSRSRLAVPEALAIQEYWSKVINPDARRVDKFKGGGPGGAIVLRKGVPRNGGAAKEGICCVYFVVGKLHFLVMVSLKELNKMNEWMGKGRDRLQMTNHAKTFKYGLKAAKEKGHGSFRKVDACFGFWFDVSKKDGELLLAVSHAVVAGTTHTHPSHHYRYRF